MRNALQEILSVTTANAEVTDTLWHTVPPENRLTVQDRDPIHSMLLDTGVNEDKSVWSSNLTINGKEKPFKLDTGAEVTAASKETWQMLENQHSSHLTNMFLDLPSSL